MSVVEQVKLKLYRLPPEALVEVLRYVTELSERGGARGVPSKTPPESCDPRASLFGLWSDHGPGVSVEEIRELRREMWKNFPREHLL